MSDPAQDHTILSLCQPRDKTADFGNFLKSISYHFLTFPIVTTLFHSSSAYAWFVIHACMLSHFSSVQVCATLWTIACQVPLSIGCSRQEYWSGLPCPLPGDLPNPGIKPGYPALQAFSLLAEQVGENTKITEWPPTLRDEIGVVGAEWDIKIPCTRVSIT